MCLAFPGKVTKIEGRKAFVQYPGEVREALIGEDNVKVGDSVLVQMGIIIQVISKSELNKRTKAFTRS
jgi:hydrogenase expression/formation protein HypC